MQNSDNGHSKTENGSFFYIKTKQKKIQRMIHGKQADREGVIWLVRFILCFTLHSCPSTCKKGLKVICSYFVNFIFIFLFSIFICAFFCETFCLFILSAEFASLWKFCFYYYYFFYFEIYMVFYYNIFS